MGHWFDLLYLLQQGHDGTDVVWEELPADEFLERRVEFLEKPAHSPVNVGQLVQVLEQPQEVEEKTRFIGDEEVDQDSGVPRASLHVALEQSLRLKVKTRLTGERGQADIDVDETEERLDGVIVLLEEESDQRS